MAKAPAPIFTIKRTTHRTGSTCLHTGTLAELVEIYKNTLECGASYQREKGNVKINVNPKNVASLIKNLDNAVNNSAGSGYAGKSFSVVTA